MRSDELKARQSIPGWVLLLAIATGLLLGEFRACDDDGGTMKPVFAAMLGGRDAGSLSNTTR